MSINDGFKHYKENSIITASPEDLTLMLFNGLVKFLMKAQKAIDGKDIQNAHNNILRAQDIIQEFIIALDKSYEISKSLELIYDYMYRRLVEANISKDNEIIDEVLDFAKELRDTWEQAARISRCQGRLQQIAK